ncbi:hypothetical protein [Streptomyces sp. NBC_00286]|uniref:hypothetical protein n=1 Tax=Streptomyces sp. NBC_00286 TaxID=2975701 RepID=UPI002E2A2FDF|nr:hypothetical protein [Streptomyces sp. NBC_00286]
MGRRRRQPPNRGRARSWPSYRTLPGIPPKSRLLPEADQLVTANDIAFDTTYNDATDDLCTARNGRPPADRIRALAPQLVATDGLRLRQSREGRM